MLRSYFSLDQPVWFSVYLSILSPEDWSSHCVAARSLYLEIVVVPRCWSNPLRGLDVSVCLSGKRKPLFIAAEISFARQICLCSVYLHFLM